jgi:hypothetical protein
MQLSQNFFIDDGKKNAYRSFDLLRRLGTYKGNGILGYAVVNIQYPCIIFTYKIKYVRINTYYVICYYNMHVFVLYLSRTYVIIISRIHQRRYFIAFITISIYIIVFSLTHSYRVLIAL